MAETNKARMVDRLMHSLKISLFPINISKQHIFLQNDETLEKKTKFFGLQTYFGIKNDLSKTGSLYRKKMI